MQRIRSECPALKVGHLQKQFVHALSANVNRKGQAGKTGKQNKHSEEQEKLNGRRTTETARGEGMGMGLWVAGSSPLTVGGNCVNMVKAQNEEDDDENEVVDDDNVASGGTRQGKCGTLALGGRDEIGTQLFHFASVRV